MTVQRRPTQRVNKREMGMVVFGTNIIEPMAMGNDH